MARDGCNFYFSFWAIFAFYVPPSSIAAQKIKIKKKEKNAWRNKISYKICHKILTLVDVQNLPVTLLPFD